MLDFLIAPLIVGICVAGTYGLFELFARRKERLAIIEKMGEGVPLDPKFGLPSYFKGVSFNALKIGCLMAGIGLGIMIGFFINISFVNDIQMGDWRNQEMYGAVYGASVLLCGGIGLIVAFILEMKINKKKE